ncbi:hypothetical protein BLS_005717 [Venturia inaequalis]|uniref:Uncharacterized protein n=1 Tax=Venturia inaequalis TaxID=5025 RepID=A0A8H3UIQ0_VENIN|nr:hypothetical protein EG328_006304 [Venturia inaequalis]KAE9985751.1 hypothetical protein BLS_005717 [Venturia inaequalis]
MSEPPTVPDEQLQSATDISPQSTSAHEAVQKLWTQAPQPLPGPDDHPFFKIFAPNAYGSFLQLDITAVAPETHTTADAEIASKGPAGEMPLVYPFLPAPSISMEPLTPDNVHDTYPVETPTASTSQLSTPPLSFFNSDDQESSPEPRSSSDKRPKGSRIMTLRDKVPREKEDDGITPPIQATRTNQRPAQEDLNKTEVEATCILTYMRAIPNSETSEPAVIANGQIWRSPDKRKGWRRNQWIVDVR